MAREQTIISQYLGDSGNTAPDISLFPNYLQELTKLPEDEYIRLIAGYMQSVLERLLIPHKHAGNTVNTDYFNHLMDYCKTLVAAEDADIEIDLYISGGVVCALLANLYKFVYERKQAQALIGQPCNVDALRQPIPEALRMPVPMKKNQAGKAVPIAKEAELGTTMAENEVKATIKRQQK